MNSFLLLRRPVRAGSRCTRKRACTFTARCSLSSHTGASLRLSLSAVAPFSRRQLRRSGTPQGSSLGDGDVGAEVNVLNGVEELDAFLHGALERFAAGDETRAASALVDNRSGDGFLEIVCSGSAATVDQDSAAHVAVGDLIARQVDGMIAAEVRVYALVKFAVAGITHVEGLITAVIFRELLLDDVRLDG